VRLQTRQVFRYDHQSLASELILDERRRASIPKPSCSFATRLRVLVAGRTTIAVAHRLSTIQLHDPGHGPKPRVPQGQLRGAGTHQELLAEHGIYFKLFEPQYKSANLVSKSA